MNSKTLIHILKTASPKLKEKYPIQSIAMFGSVLRDDFCDASDVDLLIDYQSDNFNLFSQLADELEQILGRKVDIITLRSLKSRQWDFLKDQILYV